jgi:uncharacterized membrane protein
MVTILGTVGATVFLKERMTSPYSAGTALVISGIMLLI